LRKLSLFLICIILITTSSLASADELVESTVDYADHWAKMYITEAIESGILTPVSPGQFYPDQPITRGDLAGALARALNVAPSSNSSFVDTKEHPDHKLIAGLAQEELLSNTKEQFRPFEAITRQEAVSMINGCFKLGLADETDTEQQTSIFVDLDPSHSAFRQAKIADVLGVLPPTFVGRFQPDLPLTRAEAAAMLNNVRQLRPIHGEIKEMDQGSGTITVTTREGEETQVSISPQTLVYRNNAQTDLQNLKKQDKIYAVEDRFGQTKVVKAFGIITPQDLLSRVSGMTQGILTPTQVSELVSGNWDQALEGMAGNLSSNIFSELTELGFPKEEVSQLQNQDWEALEQTAKKEIYQTVGDNLKLPEEMVNAAANEDWAALGDFAKLHLAAALLSRLGVM
jgi:Cu/Ag efflux protein CusF